MANARIGNGILTVVATDDYTPNGAVRYRWTIEANGKTWTDNDLSGPPAGGENEDEMIRSLCSFLGAALESRDYRNRTGRKGDNEDLFPADLLDWASEYDTEITLMGMD